MVDSGLLEPYKNNIFTEIICFTVFSIGAVLFLYKEDVQRMVYWNNYTIGYT